jgi:hypothetical protein
MMPAICSLKNQKPVRNQFRIGFFFRYPFLKSLGLRFGYKSYQLLLVHQRGNPHFVAVQLEFDLKQEHLAFSNSVSTT